MNELVTVADATLSDTFTTIIGDLGTQFTAAVPAVATGAGAIIVVMIGVPLVVKLFRRLVG